MKRLLKVPCCETKEEDEMSEADSSHLETLLRAHEEAMAGQRSKLDAAALASTFAPLLAAVAKLEGPRPGSPHTPVPCPRPAGRCSSS